MSNRGRAMPPWSITFVPQDDPRYPDRFVPCSARPDVAADDPQRWFEVPGLRHVEEVETPARRVGSKHGIGPR